MRQPRTRASTTLATLLLLFGAAVSSAAGFSSYLELRIYPVSDQDRFLEYFEEHYLESQEVVGMRIWGQFRDLESETQFVWLRGYRSMEERLSGLKQFYTSPVWAETGPEAVSMLTARASHVHFLEPVTKADGFAANWGRPPLLSESPVAAVGVLIATVFPVRNDPSAVAEAVRSTFVPQIEAGGGTPLGLFRSSSESNNFPILPFIEDETVVVLFSSFESPERYAAATEALEGPEPSETFVLEPGRRSRLRHRAGS